MSELIADKVLKEILDELVFKDGENKPFATSLVDKYIKDLLTEVQLLVKSGSRVEDLQEYYLQEFRSVIKDNVVKAFQNSSEFKDSLYKKSYERLKALGEENKTYGDLFTEIYDDESYLNEIFVRLVEEGEEVAITSAKQLQELTGITEIYPELNEPEAERTKKTTKKEALAEATRQIEQTFTQAMSYRYSKALEDILEAGGKYSDLLQIKPSYFNLPETWSGCLPTDQYSSILWAIENAFLIGEPNTTVRPDLKTIAQEIEAPYSVLMDAHKLPHFLHEIDRTVKSRVGDLERRLKKEVRVYIDKQSEEWKAERLMVVTDKRSQEKVDLQIYQYVSMFIVWFNVILFSEVEPNKELSKMDKDIIKAHKAIIYKEFKPFLEEGKAIYSLPEVEKEILKKSRAK